MYSSVGSVGDEAWALQLRDSRQGTQAPRLPMQLAECAAALASTVSHELLKTRLLMHGGGLPPSGSGLAKRRKCVVEGHDGPGPAVQWGPSHRY